MAEEVTFGDDYCLVGGVRTHVQAAGSGPPMLLVHGLGGPLVWTRIRYPLAAHFRVVIADLPGFGDSGPAPFAMTTAQHADFLVSLLRVLELQEVFTVGISYGGQVAAALAGSHPETCPALGLISSTGFLRSSLLARNTLFRRMFDAAARHVVIPSERLTCLLSRHAFHRVSRRPPEYCSVFHRQISRPGAADAWLNAFHNVFENRGDLRPNLTSIRVPTLILWGDRDRTVPVGHAELFRRSIAASRLRIVQDCAHALPLEAPAEVSEALREFFTTLTSGLSTTPGMS